MTLLEMKKKILRMIEEISDGSTKLTDDPDIEKKLSDVINQVMFELARMKKIPAKASKEVTGEDFLLTSLEDFYQLDRVTFKDEKNELAEVKVFGNIVETSGPGTATFYYFKYPKRITDSTIDKEYIFELTDDVLEILPYGAAADLLKSDVSNNYGQVYAARYAELKEMLDPRHYMGSIYIEGGIDI